MNPKTKNIISVLFILAILGGLGFYLFKKNFGTVSIPGSATPPAETPGAPVAFLKAPAGVNIEIFAKDVPGARVMAFDGFGNMWVSQTSEGKITQLEIKDGILVGQNTVLKNLDRPHGLAIDGNTMYFAEVSKITRLALYSDDRGQKIADLPKGGTHFTRTLLLAPDGKLYVSIGSTCNVCHESDERLASIYSLNKDGTDFKQVAKGLRNSVFMAVNPADGKIYATEMGRDGLGDDIPPDEVNIIENKSDQPQNYGWPNCYGKNIHDTAFDKNTYIRNPCMEPFETPSWLDLQAHSAPLGLAFYKNNLFIAYHGSWNRSVPTGYKIVKVVNGKPVDFITGWLTADGKKLGRPVDIKPSPDGSALYVTDDSAGVIYKITGIK